MKKTITELKGAHAAADIWIIAAGPSLNHIHPSFFDNKITIGVNRVCKFFKCDYVVAKDGRGFKEIISSTDNDSKLILSKHESGNPHQNLNTVEGEHYIFDHPAKPGEKPDISCIAENSDQIVVSYSTITSAIHIAAYMGAKNIILCGHDCGTIDDNLYTNGYLEKDWKSAGNWSGIGTFLSKAENESVSVKEYLKERYSVNIYSINPFLNLSLEGHKFVAC